MNIRMACIGILMVLPCAGMSQELPTQEGATPKSLGVVQFGYPADSTYIFCDGLDCPERSAKHIYVPPAPKPAAKPLEQSRTNAEPLPIIDFTKEGLSHAKKDSSPQPKQSTPKRKLTRKPAKAKKQAVICAPVA